MRTLFRLAILVAVAVGAAYLVTTEPDLRDRLPWDAGSVAVATPEPTGTGSAASSIGPQIPEGVTAVGADGSGAQAWELTAVRSGRNVGFDRIVLDSVAGAPRWSAERDVEGDGARLRVTMPAPVAATGLEAEACQDGGVRLQAVERCTWTSHDHSATLEIELDRVAPHRIHVVDQSLAIDIWASGEVGAGTGVPADAVTGFVFAWDHGSRTEMGDYASGAVMASFADDAIEGQVAMDVPSCTAAAKTARCEDVWVYEDLEDHTATVGYLTFDLTEIDGAWWITGISCDPIYEC